MTTPHDVFFETVANKRKLLTDAGWNGSYDRVFDVEQAFLALVSCRDTRAVSWKTTMTASKNSRLKILRNADFLKSVKVFLFPGENQCSVTLFAGVQIPDPQDPSGDWRFNKNTHVMYLPILTEDGTKRCFDGLDIPIPAELKLSLSISGREMTRWESIPYKVQLEFLMIDNELQKTPGFRTHIETLDYIYNPKPTDFDFRKFVPM